MPTSRAPGTGASAITTLSVVWAARGPQPTSLSGRWLPIPARDRVRRRLIVPVSTVAASFEAVFYAGHAVVVDISKHDLCLDPPAVESAVDARTHFLLSDHLYGQLVGPASLLERFNWEIEERQLVECYAAPSPGPAGGRDEVRS